MEENPEDPEDPTPPLRTILERSTSSIGIRPALGGAEETATLDAVGPENYRAISISSCDTASVDVEVGSGELRKTFKIHKRLLCASSHHFAAALNTNSKFRESIENKLELPDADPFVFAYYAVWMYKGMIGVVRRQATTHYKPLLLLYTFSDQYLVPQLGRWVIFWFRSLVRRRCKFPPTETVNLAFEMLPSSSPLLDLLVDLYIEILSEEDGSFVLHPEQAAKFSHEFLEKLHPKLSKLLNDVPKKEWRRVTGLDDLCSYHRHPDEESKKKCFIDGAARNFYVPKA